MVLCDLNPGAHRDANRKRREAPHGEAGSGRHNRHPGRGSEEVRQAEYGFARAAGQGE